MRALRLGIGLRRWSRLSRSSDDVKMYDSDEGR